MKKFFLCFAFCCLHCMAATDYTMLGDGKSAQIVAVTTGATITVTVAGRNYLIVHLNVSDDSGTASGGTDRIVVMNNTDAVGNAVTMNTTFAAGFKTPVLAGGTASLRGDDVPQDANGARVIQIKAVGGNARVLILRD